MLSPYRGRGFYDPLTEMNRMFEQMFGGLARRGGDEQRTQLAGWSPAIDVLQRDEDLVVRAELPGVKPEDVDITVQNGVLTISGRIQEEREEERRGYLVRERRYGTFRRSLQLPQDVDENQIRAHFENGVLEITIPGAAAAQEPRRIQVEAGDSPTATNGPSIRSSRAEEAPPRTQAEQGEGAGRQPQREEDEGLLERAKEALLGEEEEERRRREATDRPPEDRM